MNSKFWNWIGWGAIVIGLVSIAMLVYTTFNLPKRTVLPFYSVPKLRVLLVEVPTPLGVDLYILDTGSTRSVDIWGQKLCIHYECTSTDLPDLYLAGQMLLTNKFLPEDITVRGLLGEDLLQRFSRVEIDYVNQTISLEE